MPGPTGKHQGLSGGGGSKGKVQSENFYYGFSWEERVRQGAGSRWASWNNLSEIRGVRAVPCVVCPRLAGQVDSGSEGESPVRKRVGDVTSGLVGLHL